MGLSKAKRESAKIVSRLKKKKAGEFRIGMDFNIFDIMCGSLKDGSTWWSGYSEYRPKEFNGDFSVKKWTNPFKCKQENRSHIGSDSDVEVAVTKTSTKDGASSLFGSNLKASQKWEETQRVAYEKIKKASEGYFLCGFEDKYFRAVTAVKQV